MLSFRRKDCSPQAGPAFISKAERGEPWGGSERELTRIENKEDFTKLVIFDTWIRNEDRYFPRVVPEKSRINYDNVFLSEDAPEGQLLLRAIDHSDCFTNGRDIVRKNLGIDAIQEGRIYGLFPEFRGYLDRDVANRVITRLKTMDKATARQLVDSIPLAWNVTVDARNALIDFIVERASFVSRTIISLLWPQMDLFADPPEANP